MLSAGISHEINNPVSFILGNVKTLEALWRDSAPGLRDGLPKLDNYLQVNGYANAINLGGQDVGDVHIDKIVIIYVDRGRPWYDWLPFTMPVSPKVFRETVGLVRQASQSIETMTIPPGICRAKTDTMAHWCEARELCFSELLDTRLHDKVFPEDLTPQAEVEGLLRLRAARSDEGTET